jgi:FkbM family methyltransferase
MLLKFNKICEKYNLNIKGIIHVGAHYGQEHQQYKDKNIKNLMYFEPLKSNFEILKSKISDSILHNVALGNENKYVDMYVETANEGMSSSILKPKDHLTQYPHIIFDKTEKVKMCRLDEIEFNRENFNFINVDVQGYELEVFKGASVFLKNVDYIITEVNNSEVYENCAKVDELDKFLSVYGFERVETRWAGGTWGDAFYIKK